MVSSVAPDTYVSHSQITKFRSCEQAYAYQYVDKLTKIGQAPRLDLGIWLHDYLSQYYALAALGEAPVAAHKAALLSVHKGAKEKCEEHAASAYMMGNEALGAIYLDMPEKLVRLALGYYRIRGKYDPDRYEILLNEAQLRLMIDPEIKHSGYVDLVTRDRVHGTVRLWEHKSHEALPSPGFRLRNLQVALYAPNIELDYGHHVDGVLWNYIITAEPKVPARNQSDKPGKMISRAETSTTWDVYQQAILDAGDDPALYGDIALKLAGRPESAYFPRFELPLQPGGAFLIRDYATDAREIREKKQAWASGTTAPVRNIGFNCDRCEFVALCDAAIQLGVEADPHNFGYTTKARRETPQ